MFRILAIFIVLSVSFGSCHPDPNQILANHKVWIDTLVARQAKVLRPKLDSICTADFDKMVAAAADSILVVRLKNIEVIKDN